MLLISYFLFVIVAIYNISFWVYLWQLKEYRLDRLSVHVLDTQQGRNVIFSYNFLFPIFGILIYITNIFTENIVRNFSLISVGILLIVLILDTRGFFLKKFKKPKFTVKAAGVGFLSLVLIGILSLLPLTDTFLWQLIILLVSPFFVALMVFLFAFPTEVYTDIYIQRAKEKRKSLKKLQVIAVSGSYGKSSTKEVIAAVLSQKYNVVKTNFSNNTPLIIAKTILTKIHNNTDFFVVELGAYKRGEIRQLAEMVGPTISVTTAVSDQHLALYGDMNDVIESELELIKELPKDAPILLNGNSRGVLLMAKKIKQKDIVWYAYKKSTKSIQAVNVMPNINGVAWDYVFKNQTIHFSSPLLGVHTIENILPAVYLGLSFGISPEKMQSIIKNLKPLSKTMEKVATTLQAKVIDDSFNASPESVISAIDYLSLSSHRKFFVLSPLIELGKMSKARHEELGRHLAKIDYLFLTNKNFLREIKKGISDMKGNTDIFIGSYKTIAQKIKQQSRKSDIIVFEGKEAGIVLKYFI